MAEWFRLVAEFDQFFGDFCLIIFRWPNCRKSRKIKQLFGLFCSNFLGMLSTININLVSDEYECRKQGLEANIQTRVYREFLFATNTRVGIVLIHLEQNTVRIESLGQGKRLRLW